MSNEPSVLLTPPFCSPPRTTEAVVGNYELNSQINDSKLYGFVVVPFLRRFTVTVPLQVSFSVVPVLIPLPPLSTRA